MSEEVQIAVYIDMAEAEVAKGLLTSNGVPCMLAHDNAGSAYPQFNQTEGVRLVVPAEFAAQGRALLEAAQAEAKKKRPKT